MIDYNTKINNEMTNLEWLKKMKNSDETNGNVLYQEEGSPLIKVRTMKAIEIIAEQTIHLDDTLAYVLSALENIETTLNRR